MAHVARVNTVMDCQLIYVDSAQSEQVTALIDLAAQHQVAIDLQPTLMVEKLNQKRREQLSGQTNAACPILLLDAKNKLSMLTDGMSAAPEWDKLQRRVVSAGRKSELLLQATKVSADSRVIDATAGFGHDSLILASSGAQVTMLEQEPLMALLLLAEQARMRNLPNWQKLMARLTIINTDAVCFFDNHQHYAPDVIYLDPMFPEDSYQDRKTGKGAKVGKHMQALHHLASPPTRMQEQQLLNQAKALVSPQQGRVIVKRPRQAPPLAGQAPTEQWQNDALRFDGYF